MATPLTQTSETQVARVDMLQARTLGALERSAIWRMRIAAWTFTIILFSLALGNHDLAVMASLVVIRAILSISKRVEKHEAVLLVTAMHIFAAVLAWELRVAGLSHFGFFIAGALSAGPSNPRLVWLGAAGGIVAQLVTELAYPAAVETQALRFGLFVVGATFFSYLMADLAGSRRRRVLRLARRRARMELNTASVSRQLVRAQYTERRLVDVAAQMRETQDNLRRDVKVRQEMADALSAAMVRAEEANKAKSAFLARMSHELRTPLNSVIGFSSLVLKNARTRLMTREVEYLERVRANGSHLLTLINDILDLSKIEAGHMPVDHVDVALTTIVRDVVALLEPQLKPGVALSADVPNDEHVVKADPARLKQVLINLVGNAIKFTEQGSVVVRLNFDGDGVPASIAVQDTGIGIPITRQSAVFEPFEQADNSTSRQHGGTGLGLSICRQLCELMHMQLTLESEVGKGSTFTVAFSRAPSNLAPSLLLPSLTATASHVDNAF